MSGVVWYQPTVTVFVTAHKPLLRCGHPTLWQRQHPYSEFPRRRFAAWLPEWRPFVSEIYFNIVIGSIRRHCMRLCSVCGEQRVNHVDDDGLVLLIQSGQRTRLPSPIPIFMRAAPESDITRCKPSVRASVRPLQASDTETESRKKIKVARNTPRDNCYCRCVFLMTRGSRSRGHVWDVTLSVTYRCRWKIHCRCCRPTVLYSLHCVLPTGFHVHVSRTLSLIVWQ